MSTKFIDDGTDSTGGFEFWSSTSGTVTSDTGTVKDGLRSIKFAVASSNASLVKTGIMADAGRRVSLYVQFSAFPSAANKQKFLSIRQNSINDTIALMVTSGGVLQVGSSTAATNPPTQIGTNGATLLINTWYRISLAYTITSTIVNRIEVFVNGASSNSITNATLVSTSTDELQIGLINNASATINAFFDSIYVDDSAALTDPGDVRATCKRGNLLNTNNFDTLGGSGTNRYDRISDVPISETNYIQHAASTDVQENFTLQTASQGDVNITGAAIVARQAWVWAKTTAYPTPTFGTAGSVTRFTSSSSPVTQSFTAGSTTTLIVLMIVTDGAVARAGGAPTYNGVAMTQAGSTQGANASFETTVELFYLIGINDGSAHNFSIPNTGSKTLYFNCATAVPIAGTTFALDSTSIQQGTNAGAANPTHTITPTAGGSIIFQVLGDGRLTAPTAQTGTLISTNDEGSFSDSFQYVLQGVAAAVDVGWTVASDDWCMITAAFIPSVSQGTPAPKIMDNGTETAITLTTTSSLYSIITDSAAYPSNAAGIGMRSTGNSQDTFFYEGGTIIAYIPGKGFPFNRTNPMPQLLR